MGRLGALSRPTTAADGGGGYTATPMGAADTRRRPDARWQVLAGTRFVLAVTVVAGHQCWFVRPADAGPLPAVATLGGLAAILGFLVISGYSIAHSLSRRRQGFYRRRVLRIYPLYAAAVLYAMVPFASGWDYLSSAMPGLDFGRPGARVVVGNLLLVQNLVCRPMDTNLPVWTLGVEVALYGLAPLLAAWRPRGVLGLAVASGLAYAVYPRLGLGELYQLRFGLPLLLLAWAWLGGFLLHRAGTSAVAGWVVALVGGALMAENHCGARAVAVFVAVVGVVAVAGRVPVNRSVGRVLDYLGDLSYPLYLFHLPTFLLAYSIMGVRSPAALLAAAVGVSAAALFVEATFKPVLIGRPPRSAVSTGAGTPSV